MNASEIGVSMQFPVMRYRAAVAAVLVLSTASTQLVASADTLASGHLLYPGQSRTSLNGHYSLVYQTDGNLVLYGPGGVVAATMTFGTPGAAVMQADGNLVVYSASAVPQWASLTSGNPGAYLVVQNDGRVVLYQPNGTPIWAAP